MAHLDHCERVWDRGAIDKVWITDFTYLRSGEGWGYLIAIRDAHSKRVLGYAMGDEQNTDLVTQALAMAMDNRGNARPEAVVLHADRGCQFTSTQLSRFATNIGATLSMGRTGVCWDNAMAESFWASLKMRSSTAVLTPLGDKFTAISPPGSRGFITTKESTHPSGCKALSSTSLPSNSTPPRRPRHLTQLSTICGQPQSGGTTRPGCPHRWATAHRTRSTPNGPPPPLSHPLWRRKPRKTASTKPGA